MRCRFLTTGVLTLVLVTLACTSYGQFFGASGARALGMAGSSVLLADEYAIFNNPGGTEATNLSFIATYNTQFLTLRLSDAQAAILLPFSKFTTGVGIMFFGDDLLNQIKVSGLIADEFGFARTGLRLNYHQIYVQNYGYHQAVSFDLGGIFTITRQITFALAFNNLTQAKLHGEADQKLNSLIQAGFSYQPIKQLSISFQIDKPVDDAVIVRAGMEYRITPQAAIRTGFSPQTNQAAFGCGFTWPAFSLDLAGNYHANLGYSGVISIKTSLIRP